MFVSCGKFRLSQISLEVEILGDSKPVTVHKRLSRIFSYLEALNQARNPAVSVIDDQRWALRLRDLPSHPSVQVGVAPSRAEDRVENTNGDHVLRVQRPALSRPPEPPAILSDWLERGWDKYPGQIKTLEFRNITDDVGNPVVERFDDNPERTTALADWSSHRSAWVEAENPAREAMKVFEKLYELYGELEREEERYEIILGDGQLNWRCGDGGVNHPVLLQRLRFAFDPTVPEFVLYNSDHSPELYSSLFRAMPEVDGRRLAAAREKVEQEWFHPLEQEDTTAFLRYFVQQLAPQAEFLDEAADWRVQLDHPRIWRDPVIFVRQRSLGFASAIEAIIEDIERRKSFPISLVNISGAPTRPESDPSGLNEEPANSEPQSVDERDILFSKPANQEQFQIAARLQSSGCVLVQGPPGTGKTHTIANLIGHLLASGKSVLVTSHTTKALRVLRQKVVEKLRPLCVSLLESDSESRKELEGAVSGIVHRLANESEAELRGKAEIFRSRRTELYNKLESAERLLVDCVKDEYRDIVIAGESYRPAEAARTVRQFFVDDSWIPSPVRHGSALPLTEEQLAELYWTSTAVSAGDERELDRPLVELELVPSPSRFTSEIADLQMLSSEDLLQGGELWKADSLTIEYLESLASRIETVQKFLEVEAQELWKLHVVAAGQRGDATAGPWRNLLDRIHTVSVEYEDLQEALYQHGPVIEGELGDEEFAVLQELSSRMTAEGHISKWSLLIHPAWKKLLSRVTVSGRVPQNSSELDVIVRYARAVRSRKELLRRWDRQIQPIGGPAAEGLGPEPLVVLRQYAELIKEAVEWHGKHWKPLTTEVETIADWSRFVSMEQPVVSPVGDLLRESHALRSFIGALQRKVQLLRKAKIEQDLRDCLSLLESRMGQNPAEVIQLLADAIKMRDCTSYQAAYDRLVSLVQLRGTLTRRRELLDNLATVAPGWANAIRNRIAPHGAGKVPGDCSKAWLWRQFHDELELRNRMSPSELQAQIETLKLELDHLNTDLIDASAWGYQIGRIKREQQQALIGWLDTIKHIGRGTGKRVPRLLQEAKELMNQSKSAVPVWIMPLSRVVENFDPASTRFDVLIIDEASQCDILGLIAMYMADQVVVVGDHEQVSPEGVGQNVDEVQHLIDSHLTGIPNAHLYDGRMSVYDLARQSFGGLICLREHFRCVPEIIHFSSELSYNWQIKPLRDASEVALKPHTIAIRTNGVRDGGKSNEIEARHVCSLLMSCLEQPAYEGKTFGIISLLGEEQAFKIEKMLRSVLPPAVFTSRRLLCGNAAQFQGDERDVIFLSMVDSADSGPLVMRDDDRFRKRFNVAASRAKDQMWLVHSLNHETDLKKGDLRRRLIEHALKPTAASSKLAKAEKGADSEFEREVIRRLTSAGYQVQSHKRVGYFEIDIVVEGDGKRLAVECDGDRYHTRHNFADDMERQATLERLGWRFVRIRGSEFFRDPDRTMTPVFTRLDRLGVAKASGHQSNVRVNASLIQEVIRRAEHIRASWDIDNGEGLSGEHEGSPA